MKWFKHETNARYSEKLSALEQRTGLEGYGFYFKTLEIVAGLMDASDRHEAEFSPTSWARQTNISTKKWLYLAQCAADVGLMTVQHGADVVSVKIPKLLKRRDNYTKNLQVGFAEQFQNVSIEVEENRSRREKAVGAPDATASPTPTASAKKGTRLPDDWQPSGDLLAWAKQKRPDLNLPDTVERFCNYWQAKSGKDACKLDWDKTFRNWVFGQKADPFTKPTLPQPSPVAEKKVETPEQVAERRIVVAKDWARAQVNIGQMTVEEAQMYVANYVALIRGKVAA